MISLVLIMCGIFIYFYVPITIHFVKLLLGCEDLSYPLLMKANYVIVDPKKNDFTFLIYTIISRYYMNYVMLDFFLVGALTLDIFFYVSCFMESVKLRFQHLVKNEDEMDEVEVTQVIQELIEEQNSATNIVKLLDNVARNVMLIQFILYSFSLCFVLFNLTKVVSSRHNFVHNFLIALSFQIADNYFFLATSCCFICNTQFEQFVVSLLGNKIQSEVSDFK